MVFPWRVSSLSKASVRQLLLLVCGHVGGESSLTKAGVQVEKHGTGPVVRQVVLLDQVPLFVGVITLLQDHHPDVGWSMIPHKVFGLVAESTRAVAQEHYVRVLKGGGGGAVAVLLKRGWVIVVAG